MSLQRETMLDEWNKRAEENAYYWVRTDREQWDKQEYYAEGERDVSRYVLPFLASNGVDPKTLHALDIGCGTGRLTRALANVFRDVIGVDVSEKMVATAKRDNADVPNADFRVTSGIALDGIPDASIDFCFSFITFQHIPRKSIVIRYFAEILRALKTGGVAKIQVRGAPGKAGGNVVRFLGFDRFYVALVLWNGWLPLPWIRRYDTLFGACFRRTELERTLMQLGFGNVRVFHENAKYLWAEVRKP